jgi:DNA repair protein RadC
MVYSATKIKTWAVNDQPKEKILSKGLSSISDAELLSIIIGRGTIDKNQLDIARLLLSSVGNSLNELAKLSISELCKHAHSGVTKLKALQIVSALEIGRRRNMEEVIKKSKIGSSKDVFDLFHPLIGDLPHEEFWVAYLNRANRMIDQVKISQGGISGTIIDTRLILRNAIEKLASSIILCHNHPSGNLQPSDSDRQITEKVKNSALLLDCNVLDHVIIADNSFYSFADQGII